MSSLKTIIDISDRLIAGEDVEGNELYVLAECVSCLLPHIDTFIEEYGLDCSEYPEEYLARNQSARIDAIKAFANILEEVECFAD